MLQWCSYGKGSLRVFTIVSLFNSYKGLDIQHRGGAQQLKAFASLPNRSWEALYKCCLDLLILNSSINVLIIVLLILGASQSSSQALFSSPSRE